MKNMLKLYKLHEYINAINIVFGAVRNVQQKYNLIKVLCM
jgi:hypothetical protein